MFISVGPPSFLNLALIGLTRAISPDFDYFAIHPYALEILQTMALFVAIFLWSLAFWVFCISAVSVLHGMRRTSFHLVWWAIVFPNVGFTIATIDIGQQLNGQGILWVGSVMTVLLVVAWILVMASNVKAVLKKQIMMPGVNEDKGKH